MRDLLCQFSLRALALAAATLTASVAFANQTVFWLEPRSNVTFDKQVTREIGQRAGLVVLRASWNNPDPDYTLKAVVGRFKADTKAPVLSYSWANRYTDAGRSEADLLRGFDNDKARALAGTKGDNDTKVDFLDVRNPDVRKRVVSQFLRARNGLGVDGFAVDLSTRTPNARPAELAKRCQAEADFCPSYAGGMDALFGELRQGLGPNAFIVYNGLFNFAPGQLKDQTKLLASTSGAAIEFFGMDPKNPKHSFTEDIRPFLEIIPTLPADRSVMVFGRGPLTYTDYAQDYLWQRYLYACFLLVARPVDFFKYHATFQVPTQRGRTGGMDYYADWGADLGAARGAARQVGGLWVREFANGLVAAAPDDGRGGTLPLGGKGYFTLEGHRRLGELRLSAGEGAILLNSERPAKPAKREIDARTMASWKWGGAQLDKMDGREVLRLAAEKQPGEHDVLLDFERSANPYEHLEIDAKLLDRSAAILAVAEVDDPKHEHTQVVLEVSGDDGKGASAALEDGAPFRSPTAKSGRDTWPTLHLKKSLKQETFGFGAAALEGTRYRFKRWSHVRLVGAVAVSRIELNNPTMRVVDKP
jgi:hypothetical protein